VGSLKVGLVTTSYQTREYPAHRFSWVFTESPWLGASVLALIAVCSFDLAWPPIRASALFYLFLIGLGLPVALLNGVAWSTAIVVLRRAPARVALLFWPAVSLMAGAWLAHHLNAFVQLHGRYRLLAITVLFACAGGSALFGAVCASFQSTERNPRGAIAERGRVCRLLLAGLLLLAACGLQVADRRFYPYQYLSAHTALRLTAFWCATMAVVAAARSRPIFRMNAARWTAVGCGWAACLLLLNDRRQIELETFESRLVPEAILDINRFLVDWDGDGYASLLAGGDCAPFNPAINPGKREIPDNGFDDNCAFGDATKKLDSFAKQPTPEQPSPLDVVVITVECLRPDHLGAYNPAYGPKGRATSPHLDRWSESATIFDNAYSPGGWTSVVIPSILRGVYPRKLRWEKYFETNFYAIVRKPLKPQLRSGEEVAHMFPLAYTDPHPPISELLKSRGMVAMAVTDDGYGAMLRSGTGVERGFTIYREVDDNNPFERSDTATVNQAIALLRTVPRHQRFFLWIHFFGTHWPPESHPGTRVYGDRDVDGYDHEIAFFDSQVTRLLDHLARAPNPVAVFISGDHGEAFYPNAHRQHGQTLEEAVLRVPLIAHVPGWPARRVFTQVSLVDLVPTILALTRTPAPPYLDGIDLSKIVGGMALPNRILLSDTWRFNYQEQIELDQIAAYTGDKKQIFDRLSGSLYRIEDKRRTERIKLIRPHWSDTLTRAIFGYIEDTGGTVDLRD
jgi:hypothetical protein